MEEYYTYYEDQRVMEASWLSKPIKGLLLDISGVLKNGNEVVHGSLSALEK